MVAGAEDMSQPLGSALAMLVAIRRFGLEEFFVDEEP